MSAWTNQICILYWNLHCTMYCTMYCTLYCTLYCSLYCTLKWTKNCTHKSKWLVWLTYSTRNIPLLATCKFYLTLDSILSWTLYCILYCTLHCTLYTVPYTILISNAKVAGWNALIPKEHLPTCLYYNGIELSTVQCSEHLSVEWDVQQYIHLSVNCTLY
jgi:hypothetical protein